MLTPQVHTHAVILSTGDELMTGQLQDANARWLSEQLVDRGILVVGHIAVGDALTDLTDAIRHSARRAPLVVMSGGLGPTDGDLTREAVCQASGDQLVVDAASRAALLEMLTRRGREMTARQERQAYRPSRAMTLPNQFGTAPGLHAGVLTDGPWKVSDLFCLPGPPGELRPMFERGVGPLLRPAVDRVVLTRLLHVIAIPEADCAQRLTDLTARDRSPLVGMTASGGILTIRIRYEAEQRDVPDGRNAAIARVDEIEAEVRSRLADHVLPGRGRSDRPGTEHLVRDMLDRARSASGAVRSLAVVESCTGGMLGEMITSVPGSSNAFVGGFVAYSNAMKASLGVSAKTLEQAGAVSAETAAEMASAGLHRADSDMCLSITGIAGPDGGTPSKPVGTVYIGLASHRRRTGLDSPAGESPVVTRRFLFTGDREDIRRRACVSALAMLYFHERGHVSGTPRLLWETS